MINKSSNKAWDEYIKKQTDASLSSGSLLGLAFISFLAVLREGAETILFYVPIVAAAGDKVHYVWIGLGVGLVALVIIYLLIQTCQICTVDSVFLLSWHSAALQSGPQSKCQTECCSV